MVSFQTHEISPTESIGDQLKSKRIAKELTLAEVEAATRIRVKYLEALEANDAAGLPSGTVAKGLLKTYCEYLGIDYKRIDSTFTKQLEKRKQYSFKAKFMPSSFSVTPKTLLVLFSILIVAAVLAYLSFQISGFAAPPALKVTSPAADAQVSAKEIVIEGTVDAGAELFLNEQILKTDINGYFKETFNLQPGNNNLKFTARNTLGRETIIERNVVANFLETTLTPTPSKGGAPATSKNILVEVNITTADSWVTVMVNGKQAYSGLMSAGSTRSFSGTEIVIDSGKPSSTEIVVNGKKWDNIPRTDGVIKDFKINQKVINNRN